LRRARPRREDRDDRGRRGRRRLRPGGRRRGALPRRHRHRHLRRRPGAVNSRSRRFRPATQADAERDGNRFEWLKPDGWRMGFRALVLELADPDAGARVIGVGRIGPNPVHPARDLVELEIAPEHRRRGHGTALLHELGKYSGKPLASKAAPGSERELFLRTLGAVTCLEVPLLRLAVAAVHDGHDGGARAVPWSDLPREQVTDALTDRYLWQHASWSPTAARDVVRPVVGEEFYEDSSHEHSIAVVRDGQITALADLYRGGADVEDGEGSAGGPGAGLSREGSLEAVDAAAPHARADVALCLAALLEQLRAVGVTSLDLDNHPTDPHTAPLLATLDREEVDPVLLLEVPGGLTAVLRELP